MILELEVSDLYQPALDGSLGEGIDDARQNHLVALALFHAVGAGGGGEAADFPHVAVERVAADVEAERLLLVGEQLLRHPLRRLRILVLAEDARTDRAARAREQREQVGLAALALALRLRR